MLMEGGGLSMNKPLCPYCGSQMETTAKSRFDEQKNEWWTGWCFCSSCGAEGPKVYGRLTMGAALDAAAGAAGGG